MRYEVTIVLEIMRKANKEQVSINGDVWKVILDVLHVTDEEKELVLMSIGSKGN